MLTGDDISRAIPQAGGNMMGRYSQEIVGWRRCSAVQRSLWATAA